MNSADGLELKSLVGSVVRLTFMDGHVVIGDLISVDVGSPGRELIYDVLSVEAWGDIPAFPLEPRRAAAASLDDLASWSLV